MTPASAVVFQWDTLQAYCRQIGMPGLEEEIAAEIEARGKGMVVRHDDRIK